MIPPYPASEIQAQPGRSQTDSPRPHAVFQAGLHSRILVQLLASQRHVIREGTHPSRVECDAAIHADAVPRLSPDTRTTLRLPRPCLDCGQRTRSGRSRCTECTRHVRRVWDRQSVRNRQNRMRGAGGGAARLRRQVNTQGGFSCMTCGSWHHANNIVIDHVVPLSRNGTDLDDNVQPLCIGCHKVKTTQEQSSPLIT